MQFAQKIDLKNNVNASPILKWAGGKIQLLPVLTQNYPSKLLEGEIKTYIEPFVGGGAVFFDLVNKYKIEQAVLFDINIELVILYNTIKHSVYDLIGELRKLEIDYLSITDEEERKAYFYNVRDKYNRSITDSIDVNPIRAAHTIYLNRTCFNGLFRVNSKGGFNVPHGRYKNPRILFEDKLLACNAALQKAEIHKADFADANNFVDGNTFIYYDPPYRPVSETSSFNSYSKEAFDDDEQIRLARFYKEMDIKGVLQLLSNSDPSNYIEDPFFDNLYIGHTIERVSAKRMINSNSEKRGELKEILVRNY